MTTECAPTRIYCIIPAAGRSRRMGTPKPLLRIGRRTMLECVIEPLAAAQVAGIVVVTTSAIARLLPAGMRARACIAINDDTASEMIDSVRVGIAHWRQAAKLTDRDGILICPADQPWLTTVDVAACVGAFVAAPHQIVIATYRGRRGHPLIFPVSLAAFVESSACDTGLNALSRSHLDRVMYTACACAGVVRDVDTPADVPAPPSGTG